jgi:hypothetical protein
MLYLTADGVDIFINKCQARPQDIFWKSYDLIIWKKNENGYSNVAGMYRNNSWGIAEKFSVNENGVWSLPKKYVKYLK